MHDKSDKSNLGYREISYHLYVHITERIELDRNHLSILIISRPYQLALYCKLVTKRNHNTSEMLCARL